MMRGIDVSTHQGTIDWKKVKSDGVEFAILRAGYGKMASQKDNKFEANYLGCKQNGIPVGAYWYSYAKDAIDAKQEAEVCLQTLKHKQFELPIFIDMEEECTRYNAREIVDAFAEVLEKNGYFVGVYSGKYFIRNNMPGVTDRYCGWIAQWANKCDYNGPYIFWQHSEKGSVKGINGNVDMDICYDESIIEKIVHGGFNGYTKTDETKTEAVTAPKPGKVITLNIDGQKVYEITL